MAVICVMIIIDNSTVISFIWKRQIWDGKTLRKSKRKIYETKEENFNDVISV